MVGAISSSSESELGKSSPKVITLPRAAEAVLPKLIGLHGSADCITRAGGFTLSGICDSVLPELPPLGSTRRVTERTRRPLPSVPSALLVAADGALLTSAAELNVRPATRAGRLVEAEALPERIACRRAIFSALAARSLSSSSIVKLFVLLTT